MTKSQNLDDALCYGTVAALAQTVSHTLLGRNPSLPGSWLELVIRYAAGSAIVAGTMTVYAVRRPQANAQDTAIVHWGILLACGAAVAGLHLVDYLHERETARALDRAYDEEDRRHVAGPPLPIRTPIPLPRRGRG